MVWYTFYIGCIASVTVASNCCVHCEVYHLDCQCTAVPPLPPLPPPPPPPSDPPRRVPPVGWPSQAVSHPDARRAGDSTGPHGLVTGEHTSSDSQLCTAHCRPAGSGAPEQSGGHPTQQRTGAATEDHQVRGREGERGGGVHIMSLCSGSPVLTG